MNQENKNYIYDKMKSLANDDKVPIRRGCNVEGGCFCSGKCQEIVGWRDKTLQEKYPTRINLNGTN